MALFYRLLPSNTYCFDNHYFKLIDSFNQIVKTNLVKINDCVLYRGSVHNSNDMIYSIFVSKTRFWSEV